MAGKRRRIFIILVYSFIRKDQYITKKVKTRIMISCSMVIYISKETTIHYKKEKGIGRERRPMICLFYSFIRI